MLHRHQYALGEFQVAINNFVPLIPEDVRREAQEKHNKLLADPLASEQQINEAMISVGKREYPYRNAFAEVTGPIAPRTRFEHAVRALPADVAEKLKAGGEASLEHLSRDPRFEEQFTPEERSTILNALYKSESKALSVLADYVAEHRAEYDAAVEKWKQAQAVIEENIATLRALAQEETPHQDDIQEAADAFDAGWSITEKDPQLEKVAAEIENFQAKLGV